MDENQSTIPTSTTFQSTTTTTTLKSSSSSSSNDNKCCNSTDDDTEIVISTSTNNTDNTMIQKNQSNVSIDVSCESIQQEQHQEREQQRTNFNPPSDIALLHQETNLLLEIMDLDTILNNGIKIDGKDFISPLKVGYNHNHNKDSSFCSNNSNNNDDDDDDDGMRNEVKRLQFAVNEIRNDIAIVASPSLLKLDVSEVDSGDIKTKEVSEKDEERKKMEDDNDVNIMVSFNQLFIIIFTILLVYSISYTIYQRMITVSNQIFDTIFFGWTNNHLEL